MRSLTLFVTVSIGLLAQPAEAQYLEGSDHRIIACDNLQSCTVFGLGAEVRIPDVFIKITRDAGPVAQPAIAIGGLIEENDPGGQPIRLSLEGSTSQFSAPLTILQDYGPAGTVDLPEDVMQTLLAGIRTADRLMIAFRNIQSEAITVSIALEGVRHALSDMDRYQGRVGTVTALIDRGEKPVESVPSAPSLPVIAVAKTPNDAPQPINLEALGDHLCEEVHEIGVGEPGISLGDLVEFSGRLAPDLMLWGLRCWRGAYNTGSILLVSRDDGTIEPIGLQVPVALRRHVEGDMVVNGTFSQEDMMLTSHAKGRGMGDCGSSARWVWDGNTFRLTHLSVMQTCHGIASENWPILWRAEIR